MPPTDEIAGIQESLRQMRRVQEEHVREDQESFRGVRDDLGAIRYALTTTERDNAVRDRRILELSDVIHGEGEAVGLKGLVDRHDQVIAQLRWFVATALAALIVIAATGLAQLMRQRGAL